MKLRRPVYLDNNATTPIDPRVLGAIEPFLHSTFGNAASRTHCFGRDAEQAVARARMQVATLLGADPKEIVWTSGSTEANNLAIKGVAEQRYPQKGHIITQMTEHPAVLDPCAYLESRGFTVTRLPVDSVGRINPLQLQAAIRPDTFLVTIMWANNEIGTIQPIHEIGEICKRHNILFHSDATQAIGRVAIDMRSMPVDMISLSGHKIYGPKGSGALYVRRKTPRIRLVPLLHGGGHESGMRSGTLNVPGIVGLGEACSIAAMDGEAEAKRLVKLLQKLEDGLKARVGRIHVHGDEVHRLPQTLNIAFEGVEAEALMMAAPEIAVSTGSACTSASLEASHVLMAIGISDDLAHRSMRFSLGRFTTEDEIDIAIEAVRSAVHRLRELNPLF